MTPIRLPMMTSITFDDISPRFLEGSRLRQIIAFAGGLDLPLTLFVVSGDLHSDADPDFLPALKEALSTGHEAALHGHRHGRNEFGLLHPIPIPLPFPTLRTQVRRLAEAATAIGKMLSVAPVGFRAPHYLSNVNTLKALNQLGFLYDSSATVYKPAHLARFRFRRLPFEPRAFRDILRIPVTGDYVYRLRATGFSRAMDAALRDFAAAEEAGAVFVVNNHPQHFQEEEFRFLKDLIHRLRNRTEFLSLKSAVEIIAKNKAGPAEKLRPGD